MNLRSCLKKLWNLKLSSLVSILILGFPSMAQNTSTFENNVFQPSIKTVLLNPIAEQFSAPIITLNSDDQLLLQFDELKPFNENYQYTIVHCNANWHPSNLSVNEYINGINVETIQGFSFSTNTFQKYVHYKVYLPSQNMKPRLAGNYAIKVFKNFNEEELVLTRRFYVLDNKTEVSGNVKGATLVDSRFSKQEVDVNVNVNNLSIPNPFSDATLVIMQNTRTNPVINGLKPRFVNGSNFVYDYEETNLFEGGNEFRFFDTRSLRNIGVNIIQKTFDTLMKATVRPETERGATAYLQYPDYNGRRVIANNDNKQENSIDYCKVLFTLKRENEYRAGQVFVFGELTDWKILPEFKMEYNKAIGAYQAEILLKQGFYNYQYVILEGDGYIDQSYTEGNHFETENDYLILFYNKNLLYDYDELVGMTRLNSRDLNKK